MPEIFPFDSGGQYPAENHLGASGQPSWGLKFPLPHEWMLKANKGAWAFLHLAYNKKDWVCKSHFYVWFRFKTM